MERKQDEVQHDMDENQTMTDVVTHQIPIFKPFMGSPDRKLQANASGKDIVPSGNIDTLGEVNMEASVTYEDVIRAGGFGARHDISSFLPVASDSTDFEATVRDARDYEEPQGDVCRPGLGWTRS